MEQQQDGIILSNLQQEFQNMERIVWNQVRYNDKNGNLPNMRWGHCSCAIADQVIYFGGYADSSYMNDIWSFNTITMEWMEIETTGDVPSNRSNCTMSYDQQNNRIVLFGGGAANKKRFNSINILNWATKQWIEIAPKANENAPWERTYHVAELFYPYLAVFGGEGVTDLDDLWLFNFTTLSWVEVPIGKNQCKPCPRRFHSSAKIENQLFIIAGCYSKYRCLSDVYSIDFTSLLETGSLQNLTWVDRKMKDNTFLTRWGHTSVVFDNKIYVFGGRFSNDLNDILVVDPIKNSILALKVSQQLPKARRRHSACFLGSSMLIFGGFNGEYFNDLHFINVFDTKKKNNASLSNANLKSISQNTQFCSDKINSSEGFEIFVSKGLLSKSFEAFEDIDYFLKSIDNKHSKSNIILILECLYRGYGQLKQISCEDYGIKIFENKIQFEAEKRKRITKDDRESIAPRRASTVNPLIALDDKSLVEFLEGQRNDKYTDIVFVVNHEFYVQANKAQVAANSSYFAHLLSSRYTEKNQIAISLERNDTILFQIMINYLTEGFLVVSKDMQTANWANLLEMANYFSVQSLVSLCENQLLHKIQDKNCQQLLVFSLDLNLEQLSMCCAENLIKAMVNKESQFNQIYKDIDDEILAKKQQTMLKKVYQLLRFDILQKKIEKEEHLASLHLKKTESQNYGENNRQEEKQNYENFS